MQLRTADTKRRHTKAQNTFPSPLIRKIPVTLATQKNIQKINI